MFACFGAKYKPKHALILGLENAGKTSLLYRTKFDGYSDIIYTEPTIGFNREQITFNDYSAFKIVGPATSIWSFLEIFRIIFGRKIEIFKISRADADSQMPVRHLGSFYWANLKISIFGQK